MKIILDTFYDYTENVFEDEYSRNIIGGSWISLLYKSAKKDGIQVVLGKRYLQENNISANDLIFSEGHTIISEKLISTGATPFIIYSGESPNVDWKFYLFIKYYTKRYKHAILFSGIKPFVYKKTQLHFFNWPNNIADARRNDVKSTTNPGRKLIMIVSNKKQHSTSAANAKYAIAKQVLMRIITKIAPQLNLIDLYSARMDAIRFFSQKEYFNLFGKGWDSTDNLTVEEKQAVSKLQPVGITDKLSLLQNYDFALCFENCIYPGYVTEKIFDCFLSGCIPIYYGDQNITDYIPSNTFIVGSSFENFNQLSVYLQQITKSEIVAYKNNIKQFLASDEFEKYTDVKFCENLLSIVKQHVLVGEDK